MAPRRQGLAAWSLCLKLSSYHTGLWPLVSTTPLFNAPNRARSLYQTERVLHAVRYLLSSPGLAFSAVIVSQSRGRRPLACARRTAYQPIPVKMTAESPSTVLPSENWRTDSVRRLPLAPDWSLFPFALYRRTWFAVIHAAADRVRLHIAHCLMRCCRNRMQTWALGRQHASLPLRSSGGLGPQGIPLIVAAGRDPAPCLWWTAARLPLAAVRRIRALHGVFALGGVWYRAPV